MSPANRLIYLIVILTTFSLLAGCESTGPKPGARANQVPSKIALTQEDTPASVRRIEAWIDRSSVIIADQIDIVVSKNYQFEVSVVGDSVSSDLNQGGIHERVATGGATAFFRNLRLKADRQMRVRVADVGTQPFLRITARGNCSHILVGETEEEHAVKRSESLQINNEEIRYR